MGKMKKVKMKDRKAANQPLAEQIEREEQAVSKASRGHKDRARAEGRADGDDAFVGDKLSKKILTQARQQLQELEDEAGGGAKPKTTSVHFPSDKKKRPQDSDDDFSSEDEDDAGGDIQLDPRRQASELGIGGADEGVFNAFRREDAAPRRTIADLIMERIEERKTEVATQMSEGGETAARGEPLDPRLVEMYEGVGEVLQRYRSGKVPKAFKVIPQFQNWEELALLTKPDKWSSAAVFRATKIFTSGLQEKMAQRFFNLLLLPRVRDEIDTYQRLNCHLYQALMKALFKPGAFFKGFLLPLCESGTCTLREATIIGSVLAKCSIPVLHSCAAMLKIAEMEYTGANSIFLRVLLDKKYALPYRVVDALVFHFLKFRNDNRELPVLWHQAFLTFTQRYKGHISSEQRDELMELCKHQQHYKITAEVRRELQNAPCRDLEVEEPMAE